MWNSQPGRAQDDVVDVGHEIRIEMVPDVVHAQHGDVPFNEMLRQGALLGDLLIGEVEHNGKLVDGASVDDGLIGLKEKLIARRARCDAPRAGVASSHTALTVHSVVVAYRAANCSCALQSGSKLFGRLGRGTSGSQRDVRALQSGSTLFERLGHGTLGSQRDAHALQSGSTLFGHLVLYCAPAAVLWPDVADGCEHPHFLHTADGCTERRRSRQKTFAVRQTAICQDSH
ncbi:uncharacterized protein LOC144737784 [Lampetra planeri]